MHALCNVGVVSVHPELASAGRGLTSHLHVEEAFRVATSVIKSHKFF